MNGERQDSACSPPGCDSSLVVVVVVVVCVCVCVWCVVCVCVECALSVRVSVARLQLAGFEACAGVLYVTYVWWTVRNSGQEAKTYVFSTYSHRRGDPPS